MFNGVDCSVHSVGAGSGVAFGCLRASNFERRHHGAGSPGSDDGRLGLHEKCKPMTKSGVRRRMGMARQALVLVYSNPM